VSAAQVVLRDGKLRRDNGVCRNTVSVELFVTSPLEAADCKPNEVDVPDVVGETLAAAQARLDGQPLRYEVVAGPAKAGQRVGIVIGQDPARGTLSAYDRVTLTVLRATQGVVPKLVGLPLDSARAKLERLKVNVHVRGGDGRVLAQRPHWGRAAAPGMRVELTVARAGTGG
jgi:beta-lactam-binding protein with PASTA domain